VLNAPFFILRNSYWLCAYFKASKQLLKTLVAINFFDKKRDKPNRYAYWHKLNILLGALQRKLDAVKKAPCS